MCVVYSNEIEADEYKNYLQFLINKGLFLSDFDHYDLAEMPGISELKAFRAKINYGYFHRN